MIVVCLVQFSVIGWHLKCTTFSFFLRFVIFQNVDAKTLPKVNVGQQKMNSWCGWLKFWSIVSRTPRYSYLSVVSTMKLNTHLHFPSAPIFIPGSISSGHHEKCSDEGWSYHASGRGKWLLDSQLTLIQLQVRSAILCNSDIFLQPAPVLYGRHFCTKNSFLIPSINESMLLG